MDQDLVKNKMLLVVVVAVVVVVVVVEVEVVVSLKQRFISIDLNVIVLSHKKQK